MENVNFNIVQPIVGVPVLRVGDRFLPLSQPAEYGQDGGRFWFIYQGTKKAKLTVDTEKLTETLEEVV